MADKKKALNYISQLNLSRKPFAPEPNLAFYYEYDALESTSAMLNRLVEGDEIMILVIGEAGSGKTSLLKRFLTASKAGWKTGHIRIQPDARSETEQQELFSEAEIDNLPAYFLQDIKDSIIIIDDAHELSTTQLTCVLKNSQLSSRSASVKRFILFGEPRLVDSVNTLTESLSSEIAISKIFIPPLTHEQTKGYLNYRLAVAGCMGRRLFSVSTIKRIHRLSGGLPGRINSMADQQLIKNFSEEKQRQKVLWGWIQKNQKALSWSAAAVAVAIIAVWVGFYYTGKQNSSPDHLGLARRVFRAKIELPAGFEKAPSLIAEALPSGKQYTDTATSEDQTAQEPARVPAILTPVEKTTELASKPPEATTPRIHVESEEASVPESASVPEKVSVNETASVTEGIPEKETIKGKSVYREKWLLSQNASYYTIQILGVHDEGLLHRFIEKDLTATQKNLAYYQTRHKGKKWYPLLFGVYASQKEASSAMQQLPPHIREASPWIRRLSSVQKAIQKQTKP